MAVIRNMVQWLFGRTGSRETPSEPIMKVEEAERHGYRVTPGGLQWTPGPRQPVDKSGWIPCHACGRIIPVVRGTTGSAGTVTYVCPFCAHGQVGTPSDHPDDQAQERCHECGTDIGGAPQCPKCSFPRGWMTVQCHCCGNRQPACVPHWVVHCDMFTLECVQCEFTSFSFCIC